MEKFKPTPKKSEPKNPLAPRQLYIPPEVGTLVREHAHKLNMNMGEFASQCILFAIKHMDK